MTSKVVEGLVKNCIPLKFVFPRKYLDHFLSSNCKIAHSFLVNVIERAQSQISLGIAHLKWIQWLFQFKFQILFNGLSHFRMTSVAYQLDLNISQSSRSIGTLPMVCLKNSSSIHRESMLRIWERANRSLPKRTLCVGCLAWLTSERTNWASSCVVSTFWNSRSPLLSIKTSFNNY